jgi:hypothetical protein
MRALRFNIEPMTSRFIGMLSSRSDMLMLSHSADRSTWVIRRIPGVRIAQRWCEGADNTLEIRLIDASSNAQCTPATEGSL